MKRDRRTIWIIVALGFLTITALAILAMDRRETQAALAEADIGARNDAAILAAGLQAYLDKFSLVPLVLADDPEVRAVLSGGTARAAHLNQRFESLAGETRAAAIYLMDADGRTVSASNWRLPTSFVGSNYAFRRYFEDARVLGSGTQFALGTVSRSPGLYIAHRVGSVDRVLGIVAVKVEFQGLEAQWRRTTAGTFVADSDGIVLITSRPEWRFNTTRPEALGARDADLDLRQFGVARPRALVLPEGARDTTASIAFGNWRLHLLRDPRDEVAAAVAQGRLYALLVVLVISAAGGAAFYYRRQRDVRAQAVVARQTQELRDQLGQANRLATLGQVAAGVGHEINQPVAAIQVFAENGVQLLGKGRAGEAGENFRRIVELAGRVGRITGELRNFARKVSTETEIVSIGRAIDGALLLLHDRIERSGIALSLPSRQARQTRVKAEPVRLEQVLVNLLTNAIDAVGQDGSIALAIDSDDQFCRLAVHDNGPGLGSAEAARLFQPFATTKPDGLGLGLVISRDIMRALGGDLSFEPGDSGACFVMRIPRG